MQRSENLVVGIALNPSNSASMIYTGLNYSCGLHYHFRPIKNLQLLTGGLLDFDCGFKYLERNVNNPINVDLSTNINLSGFAMYNIYFMRRNMSFQMSVQSPILGCMFVPMGGASYYELFELGNLSGTTHFSSLHNKQGIHGTLTVDIPFNKCVWRFGFGYKGLKYAANEMVFNRNEMSLLIGKTFDIAVFAGKKNKAPSNFISTNE